MKFGEIIILVTCISALSWVGLASKGAQSKCVEALNKVCNGEHCALGDVECASLCLRKNNNYMRSLGCGIPTVAISVLEMAVAEPEAFASMLQSSKLAAVVKYTGDKQRSKSPLFDSTALPTVLAHGMGIHVLMGYVEITKDVGKHIGYASAFQQGITGCLIPSTAFANGQVG